MNNGELHLIGLQHLENREDKVKALLVLEDSMVFEGNSFGASGEAIGEVVFNTGMVGYQEILTDPSYKGQLVTMTYPHIGNTGINSDDYESLRPWLEGFIVHEYSGSLSNWRSEEDLDSFLKRWNVVGIEGIDTRQLTRHIRDKGAMRGIISTRSSDVSSLTRKVQQAPEMLGRDLVKHVTCKKPYRFKPNLQEYEIKEFLQKPAYDDRLDLVVVDFGVKWNILRNLHYHRFQVTVVPAFTPVEEILDRNPDGVFFSNGPGDPAAVTYGIQIAKRLFGKKPLMGICLGHQIISLALGARTYKMKFGHHGINHPVKNLETGTVEITSQNHGFAVDPESFQKGSVNMTHISLNDGTLEGFRHKELPIFAIQYHPEAGPGPHNSRYLFSDFRKMILKAKG